MLGGRAACDVGTARGRGPRRRAFPGRARGNRTAMRLLDGHGAYVREGMIPDQSRDEGNPHVRLQGRGEVTRRSEIERHPQVTGPACQSGRRTATPSHHGECAFPRPFRTGSCSAVTVPPTAGNPDRRNPSEGRPASQAKGHGWETSREREIRRLVNRTATDRLERRDSAGLPREEPRASDAHAQF